MKMIVEAEKRGLKETVCACPKLGEKPLCEGGSTLIING